MSDATPPPRRGRSSDAGNATEKVLRLLEATVESGWPHRLGQIAETAAVPKASAHRILAVLVGNGFLTSDGSGSYAPGPRLLALSARVAAGQAEGGIDEILGRLQRLTGNTVHLALHTGDSVTYTHKVEGNQPVRMASRVGMPMPLHSTAIGKCVLAGLDTTELGEFAARTGLPASTPATLCTPASLAAELATVREHGYAVDDEENEQTVRCVAAPVLDQNGTVIGGVSVSTVTFLVPREQLLGWAPDVARTASAVSARLS
jgi:DNA-binding IclR family transcriptional regulator